MRPARGRAWAWAAAVAAVIAAALLAGRRCGAPDSRGQMTAAAPTERNAPPIPAADPTPGAPPVTSLPIPEGELPEPTITPEGAPPIDLPPDTQRLYEEFVPGTTEWEEVPVDDSGAQTIRFVPRSYNVIAPTPIVLDVEVVDVATGARVPLDAARVKMHVRSFATEKELALTVTDDGTHGDEHAGDQRLTGYVDVPPADRGALYGRLLAEVAIDVPGVGVRPVPQNLMYTAGPAAALTGAWRDAICDGHLCLWAEVEVRGAGLYSLMAQLYAPGKRPVALARWLGPLGVGRQWIPLRVWGKAIRDAGLDGPYDVRNVLLSQEQVEGDYAPGPTVREAHTTAAYRVADFSAAAYVEPPADRGEEIGPDHPSQWNNPPPEHDRATEGHLR